VIQGSIILYQKLRRTKEVHQSRHGKGSRSDGLGKAAVGRVLGIWIALLRGRITLLIRIAKKEDFIQLSMLNLPPKKSYAISGLVQDVILYI
jgi:hypothetical protein